MILRFLLAFLTLLAPLEAAKDSDVCGYCKFMVETFKAGLKKTDNQHFAGGNTDWEERKLGKFRTSETRFIEIMEYVCHKDHLDSTEEFSDLKDLKFKCNHMAEDTEEILEKWFFKRQELDPDIFKYICVDEAKKCCASGHYGPNCAPCPGALKGLTCFNKGKCDGAGTRLGTGKCECKAGYAGVRCSTCAAHYYEVSKTDDSIECAACFDGCASSCKGPTALDCSACRSGYRMVEKEGCVDIDECSDNGEKLCDKENEICVNTPGHYNCECKDGYKRDFDSDECILDVNAEPYDGFWRPDRTLRYIAMAGLASVGGFILAFHRTTTTLIFFIASCVATVVIEKTLDHNSIPDEAKKILGKAM